MAKTKQLAYELHHACYKACLECPQFQGWENESVFMDFGKFGDIPKHGLKNVIKFWRKYGSLLWDRGYVEYLPKHLELYFLD